MSLTEQQLQRIMPNARRQAGVFVSALNAAMVRRQINTPQRQAAFLAQVGATANSSPSRRASTPKLSINWPWPRPRSSVPNKINASRSSSAWHPVNKPTTEP